MDDPSATGAEVHRSPRGPWALLALAALALAGLAGTLLVSRSAFTPAVTLGSPLPAFEVDGWLNVPDGEQVEVAGKVVVVDCFATWCGPCREDLPKLALVAADYRSRGVTFVSLTQETSVDLPQLRRLVAETPGFDWPIGYGATRPVSQLAIRGVPTIVVFDRQGQAVWAEHSSYGLPAALDAALEDSADEG
ncbi:MAG TPA: TlpA disulfide reductase family protein [Lacipirellulaceae bacterium]|nr:TlpA disulfide reductase family protein [Lacipirellulaceae bacterium]